MEDDSDIQAGRSREEENMTSANEFLLIVNGGTQIK